MISLASPRAGAFENVRPVDDAVGESFFRRRAPTKQNISSLTWMRTMSQPLSECEPGLLASSPSIFTIHRYYYTTVFQTRHRFIAWRKDMESVLSYIPQRDLPSPLLNLLSNSLVLYQTTPYLSISSLFALGATSKSFSELIYATPSLFRHLDLSEVKSAQLPIGAIDHGGEVWRNVQIEEHLTEDELVCHPCQSPMLR